MKRMNVMYRVNSSKFLLEIMPDGSVMIWDSELESALSGYVNGADPLAPHPPSPIVASGLTEEEAFDWLMEALRLERAYIPVTRIQ